MFLPEEFQIEQIGGKPPEGPEQAVMAFMGVDGSVLP
jgi:hypothetical protein